MKKTSILFAVLLCFFAVTAQEQDNWNGLPRQEVSLGIGDCTMASLHCGYQYGFFNCCYQDPINFDDLTGTPTYHSDYYATPLFTTHYLFRITKFLWLGGNVNMMGVFGNIYDGTNDMKIGAYRETQFAIMPEIRFSYLNKKYVTLYSGFSTGYVLTAGHNGDETFVKHGIVNQITWFGVSAGHKWFGFAELGLGYKGFVNAGFGYRFNVK